MRLTNGRACVIGLLLTLSVVLLLTVILDREPTETVVPSGGESTQGESSQEVVSAQLLEPNRQTVPEAAGGSEFGPSEASRQGPPINRERHEPKTALASMAGTFLTDNPDVFGLLHSVCALAERVTLQTGSSPFPVVGVSGTLELDDLGLKGRYSVRNGSYRVSLDNQALVVVDELFKTRRIDLVFNSSLSMMELHVQHTPNASGTYGERRISGYRVSVREGELAHCVPEVVEYRTDSAGRQGWYGNADPSGAKTMVLSTGLCQSWRRVLDAR